MADPELLTHREWLGYVQPVGVVVSPPALAAAQAYVNRNIAPVQQRLLEAVEETANGAVLRDLRKFVNHVLRWDDDDLLDPPIGLECALPEYGEVLAPTFVVPEPEPEPADDDHRWLLFVQLLPDGADLDLAAALGERGWDASPEAKFERLLREKNVPIGLLTNERQLRLVYAPRGETSGHITFPVAAMTEVAGRPILAALDMLLCGERLFSLPAGQRLPAILADSRRYQNEVSTRLAGQVLAALYELVRGLQAANDHAHGALLRDVLSDNPDLVYEGLLTVLLRLVFLLYAEDRDLMPGADVYTQHYAVGGLFDRLRSDAGRHPDTMDVRYGAWAQLLSVFRIVFDGVRHGAMHLPPRQGHLFDPDRFPFLEGRPHKVLRAMGDRVEAPLISDGVIWRVLQNLVVLDGERLSYRSLDVEQIGSVYETMMGLRLEVAQGHALAIKPAKPHGAPITVNVDDLLATPPAKRMQWVREQAEQRLTEKEVAALGAAATVDAVEEAIERKIDRRATPTILPAGSMILQPNEERRRSGSFYTPRSLTEPIVEATLRPVLERLGERPTAEAILDLKICDPAVGSGAFLVEACRQLADKLVDAWHAHDSVPVIPPDSDELLHARRLVAHRCLYGVDRNPIAVDLAKLSLWLSTLARDHAFTFLDHALRRGDSLVGLDLEQLVAFHWSPGKEKDFITKAMVRDKLDESERLRGEIRAAGDDTDVGVMRLLLREADEALDDLRMVGDLAVLGFFAGGTARERQGARAELASRLWAWQQDGDGAALRGLQGEMRQERHLIPFHWPIEFPEVFDRRNPGFDAIVGNPPFLGGTKISTDHSGPYLEWLKQTFQSSGGRSDLVVYFLRRAFRSLRDGGCFGLIATKTVAQGDSRRSGLGVILSEGGTVYAADRRIKWPGEAAVTVSVIHVSRGQAARPVKLDGRVVESINAFLLASGTITEPIRLNANNGLSFAGVMPYGQGFFFEDNNPAASSLKVMQQLLNEAPENREVIFPFVGGEEILSWSAPTTSRFVINFGERSLEEARNWPTLLKIVEERVRPEREKKSAEVASWPWWKFWRTRAEMMEAIGTLSELIVKPHLSTHHAVAFVPRNYLASHNVTVFAIDSHAGFAVLQSRVHEEWVRLTSSGLEERQGYRATDSFDTFAFPHAWDKRVALAEAGTRYRRLRDELQRSRDSGLTDVYSWFNDPLERSSDIVRLRDRHDELDSAVLDAYGWSDLSVECEFILDYESEDGDGNRRKKPWRYRWPDDVRDELLARLLGLNAERAEAERLEAGDAGVGKRGRRQEATAALPFEDT